MTSYKTDPNDKQISGVHYVQSDYQCWDFILNNRLGYLEGNYVKYVTRNRYKSFPLEDLKKARHYALKLYTEAKEGKPRLFEPHGRLTAHELIRYARANELNTDEIYLLSFIDWRTVDEAKALYDAIDAYVKQRIILENDQG